MGVVTSVAFSPDGSRIYAAGYDKVVRVWALTGGSFNPTKITYRVPVGPGLAGTINALAISPDGNWLAVGGLGVVRGAAKIGQVGIVVPTVGTVSHEALEDQGAIFVFNTTSEREIKVLRGHAGVISSLTFLPARIGKPPLLVSAAVEPTDRPESSSGRMRLWDVGGEASLAETIVDTSAVGQPPSLAAWHTGNGTKDVRVGIAWSDGRVRVWDSAQGVVVKDDRPKTTDQVDITTAPTAVNGEFLAAAFDSPNGVIRTWQAGTLPPKSAATILLPPKNRTIGPFDSPRELVAFPSRPGGPIDRAAVLVRRQGVKPSSDDPNVLVLIDLILGRPISRREIGIVGNNRRRLAVSPNGRHVAIADADAQQVVVYMIADLVANAQTARPQVLRGAGANVEKVSFRKNGDNRGLFLQVDSGGKMVFDFTNRRLIDDATVWLKDSPELAGWSVRLDETSHSLTVSGPNFPMRVVNVGVEAKDVRSALLPPRRGSPFGPVLAVGWLDKNLQPLLGLFDVTSGVEVRSLAGHTAVVTSLAFSADGRLLASAAADQTVCLWSITSLGQVLGNAGKILNVRVGANNGVVIEDAPTNSLLRPRATIEGLVEAGQLRRLSTPAEFYVAMYEAKPGSTVVLRVRRREGAQRTSACRSARRRTSARRS